MNIFVSEDYFATLPDFRLIVDEVVTVFQCTVRRGLGPRLRGAGRQIGFFTEDSL
jgi:hypothetical protein